MSRGPTHHATTAGRGATSSTSIHIHLTIQINDPLVGSRLSLLFVVLISTEPSGCAMLDPSPRQHNKIKTLLKKTP